MFTKTNIEGLSVELQDSEVLLSYTGERRLLSREAREAVYAALGVAVASPKPDRWQAGELEGEQVQFVSVLRLHTAGVGAMTLEGTEKFVSLSRTETRDVLGSYEPDTHAGTLDASDEEAEAMTEAEVLSELFSERNVWIVDESQPGEKPFTHVAWPVWLQ